MEPHHEDLDERLRATMPVILKLRVTSSWTLISERFVVAQLQRTRLL